MKPEIKALDTIANSVQMLMGGDGSNLLSSINLVSTGVGLGNMLGDSITIKAIELRFMVFQPAVGGDAPNVATNLQNGVRWVRLALILDTQTNGNAAGWVDVYTGTLGLTLDRRNMSNKNRFRVLKEWLFPLVTPYGVLDGAGAEFLTPAVRVVKKYYKKCNLKIDFATQATPNIRILSEVRSNNLFIMGGVTDGEGTGGTSLTTITISSRIRFADN